MIQIFINDISKYIEFNLLLMYILLYSSNAMFVKYGYYPNITGELCGIRYKAPKITINYPKMCFKNVIKNKTINNIIDPFDYIYN